MSSSGAEGITVKDLTVKDLTVKDITVKDIMFTLGSFQKLPQHLQDDLVLRPLRVDDHLKGLYFINGI